jgi:predicted metal-dependent HD superfamily phosphohydrolase
MSASPDDVVHRAWRATIGTGHDAALTSLVERHREPHRRYHTLAHVMWVLRHVAHVVGDLALPDANVDPTAPSPAAIVRAAALYHDAIYIPRSSTNERDSARLAADVLAEVGWPAPSVRATVTLIEATAHTAPPSLPIDTTLPIDTMTSVLLDADLAILGAEPAAYDAYVRGVRAEYAHVDDASWRVGRAAVLDHFLALPTIFRTEVMRAERERRAVANLTAERRHLVGSTSPVRQ